MFTFPLPPIGGLLFGTDPPAIFRGIRSAIVDTIKRCIQRTRTHISQEILERIQPSFADYNSSSSVSWILGHFRIIATRFHRMPRSPFWRSLPETGMPVGSFLRSSKLALKTTTGNRCAVAEIHSKNPFNVSAITLAAPFGGAVYSAIRTDHKQTAKPLTYEVVYLSAMIHSTI